MRSLSKRTIALFAAAGVMLAGGTIGSTQAVLQFESGAKEAKVETGYIGVTLKENGNEIAANAKGEGITGSQALLENLLGEGESFVLGKEYDEALEVVNSGAIDEYARLVITKRWVKDGAAVTTLSPDYIELTMNEADWVIVEDSEERTILYSRSPIAAEGSLKATGTLKVSAEVADASNVTQVKDGKTITLVYEYDGVSFEIDAEVDAVQAAHGADAMKSAWGVDAAALGINVE